jgi:hypothetical protein
MEKATRSILPLQWFLGIDQHVKPLLRLPQQRASWTMIDGQVGCLGLKVVAQITFTHLSFSMAAEKTPLDWPEEQTK